MPKRVKVALALSYNGRTFMKAMKNAIYDQQINNKRYKAMQGESAKSE